MKSCTSLEFRVKLVFLCLGLVLVLLIVSFFTLLERKVLGRGHLRQGPVYVGQEGILQPFSDAVKLLRKFSRRLSEANVFSFKVVPLVGLSLALCFLSLFPWGGELISDINYFLSFFVLRSLRRYCLVFIGLVCNSKYARLGSIRGLAQTLSYEVCIVFSFVILCFPVGSFLWKRSFDLQSRGSWQVSLVPICFVFVCLIVAEANRAPFDFIEGESELVSGFNVEYRSWSFVFIFLREYLMVVVIRLIIVFLFADSLLVSVKGSCFFALMLATYLLVRGVLPRYRYDKLIAFFWQVLLPSLLALLALVSWF